MKVRVWNEVGRAEMLNCVRLSLNSLAGVDFAMPVSVWFPTNLSSGILPEITKQESPTLKHAISKSLLTLNHPLEKTVVHKSQMTDTNGESQMYIVGAPKIPAVLYQKKSIKIEKQANVVVGIKLKAGPDKDLGTNVIDTVGACDDSSWWNTRSSFTEL